MGRLSRRQTYDIFFFLFFLENRIWHFMQIVSLGDNLHEMSNPFFPRKNKKNISKCRLLKLVPSMQSVKVHLRTMQTAKTHISLYTDGTD